MPIPLDRTRTRAMTARFDEAADLVANEFAGLDHHQQYRNAFARLLKWDPLGRVLMMGTDQRDLFVPELRRVIGETMPAAGALLDVGCGDGQTFALLADAVPAGATVHFADPNPDYVARYGAMIDGSDRLTRGAGLVAGFDEIDAAARREGVALPADGSLDLVLAIHMAYFLKDLDAALTRMYRLLRPGGALAIVIADDRASYAGRAHQAYCEMQGSDAELAWLCDDTDERSRLLMDAPEALAELLDGAFPGSRAEVETTPQPSRLYGHSLADLVALAAIGSLIDVDDPAKFDAPLALLRDSPERVDLRIEDDGPRLGMLSVAQAQAVTIVRRVPAG